MSPEELHDEYDQDMAFLIIDLSTQSARSNRDMQFTYMLQDIDALLADLGIP